MYLRIYPRITEIAKERYLQMIQRVRGEGQKNMEREWKREKVRVFKPYFVFLNKSIDERKSEKNQRARAWQFEIFFFLPVWCVLWVYPKF